MIKKKKTLPILLAAIETLHKHCEYSQGLVSPPQLQTTRECYTSTISINGHINYLNIHQQLKRSNVKQFVNDLSDVDKTDLITQLQVLQDTTDLGTLNNLNLCAAHEALFSRDGLHFLVNVFLCLFLEFVEITSVFPYSMMLYTTDTYSTFHLLP